MKASLIYRVAAVLLLLFAIGHTLGFRQSDPQWGVDALLASMRSIHFDVQGFHRTYWDLFEAAGFSVGIFYVFAALLAWQLGGLPAETLARMRGIAWTFAICFAALTFVSWRYLFILPIVFAGGITVCLLAAAWLGSK
ncbi:MAG TPA: hypothetical protein VKB48_05990 [Candidatus Acidoferrum sp.]|nr:hypothetical protein [Candidatus Acidoferrum sp.]